MSLRILMILLVGILAACASPKSQPDSYTDSNGKTTVVGTDREMCIRSCNEDYGRCMDTDAGVRSGGLIDTPPGMFGASGDCRSTLKDCLTACKSR